MAVGRTGACVGSNLSQRGSSQLQLSSVDVRTYLVTRYRLSYPILANVHLRPAISFLAPEEVAVTWSVEGSQLKQLFRGVPCICSAVSSAHSLTGFYHDLLTPSFPYDQSYRDYDEASLQTFQNQISSRVGLQRGLRVRRQRSIRRETLKYSH
jgi:hypothetical protein